MSRIYFHTPTTQAELRGSERAWLGGLVTDLAIGVLSPSDSYRADRLRPLIHPGHYLAAQDPYAVDAHGRGGIHQWAASYATAFSVGWSSTAPLIQYANQPLETFGLALNTALVLGNDALKLAARLHGACELHTWVDGPNRAWLADIMQAGIDTGLYRRGFSQQVSSDSNETVWSDQGWDQVIALLRDRDDEPVVTSYSVCDQFPNEMVGDWMPPWPEGVAKDWRELTEEQQHARSERAEAWHDLVSTEQWRISMTGLIQSGDGLELRPDHWTEFRFDPGLSVLDLIAHDSDERLARALTPPTEKA